MGAATRAAAEATAITAWRQRLLLCKRDKRCLPPSSLDQAGSGCATDFGGPAPACGGGRRSPTPRVGVCRRLGSSPTRWCGVQTYQRGITQPLHGRYRKRAGWTLQKSPFAAATVRAPRLPPGLSGPDAGSRSRDRRSGGRRPGVGGAWMDEAEDLVRCPHRLLPHAPGRLWQRHGWSLACGVLTESARQARAVRRLERSRGRRRSHGPSAAGGQVRRNCRPGAISTRRRNCRPGAICIGRQRVGQAPELYWRHDGFWIAGWSCLAELCHRSRQQPPAGRPRGHRAGPRPRPPRCGPDAGRWVASADPV